MRVLYLSVIGIDKLSRRRVEFTNQVVGATIVMIKTQNLYCVKIVFFKQASSTNWYRNRDMLPHIGTCRLPFEMSSRADV